MRRLTILFVLALLGAWVYGTSGIGSGVDVNTQVVKAQTLRNELTALSTQPVLNCYMKGINYTFDSLDNATAFNAASAAQWVNLRVQGVAISQYVKKNFGYTPSASDLAKATTSLENELTAAAASNSLTCNGPSSEALAEMPKEMRAAEISSQAASLYLLSKVQITLPLTTPSLEKYYQAHKSSYDKVCVSIAVVPPAKMSDFAKAQATGATVAQLAKAFSIDPSGSAGGVYGCYGPSSSAYAAVRQDVGTTGLNKFPTTPQIVSFQGGDEALYVAITKRIPSTYAEAKSQVLSDVRAQNASGANNVTEDILYRAAIAVDPAFGQWGLSSTTGPEVFAPASPSIKNVTGATQAANAVTAS